ncbi:MAG TPA: deoxyribodipyrimidine photo-lyase, partial [Bacteroidaceae bacterium]|nr:deoxyribodipyrimidine photo-lyase [Bacteroidaceae bacterium]
MKISVFWFRRDLRLDDNTALRHALNSGLPVLPVFIFDDNIIEELSPNDARINFIYDNLHFINKELNAHGSAVLILKGDPVKVWEKLIAEYDIGGVFLNRDYEPYALLRDGKIRTLLKQSNINLHDFKDHVIFERDEIVKEDGKPYTVFTPYKKRWLANFATSSVASP